MYIRPMIYHCVYPWIYHVYTWWILYMEYPWIYHVYTWWILYCLYMVYPWIYHVYPSPVWRTYLVYPRMYHVYHLYELEGGLHIRGPTQFTFFIVESINSMIMPWCDDVGGPHIRGIYQAYSRHIMIPKIGVPDEGPSSAFQCTTYSSVLWVNFKCEPFIPKKLDIIPYFDTRIEVKICYISQKKFASGIVNSSSYSVQPGTYHLVLRYSIIPPCTAPFEYVLFTPSTHFDRNFIPSTYRVRTSHISMYSLHTE